MSRLAILMYKYRCGQVSGMQCHNAIKIARRGSHRVIYISKVRAFIGQKRLQIATSAVSHGPPANNVSRTCIFTTKAKPVRLVTRYQLHHSSQTG